MQPRARQRQSGLTLFELLIVLVIAAIILGIGSPTFSEFRRNSRLSNAANEFLSALQLARTEAIKRQQTVSICPAAQLGRRPVCNGDKFSGWIVFADHNGDCQRASGEEIVRAGEALDRTVLSASNGVCISFASSGFLRSVEDPPPASEILFCDPVWKTQEQPGTDQSAARGILVSPTGRAAITRDKDLIDTWGVTCG